MGMFTASIVMLSCAQSHQAARHNTGTLCLCYASVKKSVKSISQSKTKSKTILSDDLDRTVAAHIVHGGLISSRFQKVLQVTMTEGYKYKSSSGRREP